MTAFGLCLLLLLSAAALPALAAMDVRTGYTEYDGFCGADENGALTGPAGEILNAVEEANPAWHFVGVEYGRNEYTAKIRQGFGIIAAFYPDAGELNPTSVTFTDIPIGTEYGILYVKPDAQVFYEDFSGFNGMKVGGITESVQNKLFAQYQELNGFTAELTEYASLADLRAALDAGEIQAMVYGSAVEQSDLKIVARFSELPLYIVASNWGLQFLDGINQVLEELQAADANFAQTLFDKYYGDRPAAVQALTLEEERQRLEEEQNQQETGQPGTEEPGQADPGQTGSGEAAPGGQTEPSPSGSGLDTSALAKAGVLAAAGVALVVICVFAGKASARKKKNSSAKKEVSKKERKKAAADRKAEEAALAAAALAEESPAEESLAEAADFAELAAVTDLAGEEAGLPGLAESEETLAQAAADVDGAEAAGDEEGGGEWSFGQEDPESEAAGQDEAACADLTDLDALDNQNAPIQTAELPDAFFAMGASADASEQSAAGEEADTETRPRPEEESAEAAAEKLSEETPPAEGAEASSPAREIEVPSAAAPAESAGFRSASAEPAKESAWSARREEKHRGEPAEKEEVNLNSFGLRLFLQPGYSVENDKEIGAEAMALFQHHIRGMIYPERLITALREQGEGQLYDRFVFQSLCETQATRQINRKKFRILVPVSRESLAQPDFARWYADTAERYGAETRALRLDLSVESDQLSQELIEQFRYLKGKGFGIALKQVGSQGYPLSLIEVVKPDAVVLDDILLIPQSQELESATRLAEVKALCLRLQIPMEAERVDSREIFRLALEAGCQVLRGNFLSRPVPLEKK